jgi:hypothetical protein
MERRRLKGLQGVLSCRARRGQQRGGRHEQDDHRDNDDTGPQAAMPHYLPQPGACRQGYREAVPGWLPGYLKSHGSSSAYR